jgi:hypothetical protein
VRRARLSDNADKKTRAPLALSFASDSVTITLDPANDEGTSMVFVNDPDRCLGDVCLSFFGAVVDISGLGSVGDDVPMDFSNTGDGAYTGDPFAPASVSYSGLFLVPYNGGASVASLSFSATLAPAPLPAPILLFASGLVGLFGAGAAGRHRR